MLEYKAFFEDKNRKNLAAMIKSRVEAAVNSNVEKAKAMKISKTTMMMEMRPDRNEYVGRFRFVPPIFNIAVRSWHAGFMEAIKTDPIVTIVPKGTTQDQAGKGVQALCDWNAEETKHRESLDEAAFDTFLSGLGVIKRSFEYREFYTPTPVVGPTGEVITQTVEKWSGNDYTYRVHPQNYVQDTSSRGNNFHGQNRCNWCGEINEDSAIYFLGVSKQEGAIAENIDKLLKVVKEKQGKSHSQNLVRPADTDVQIDYDCKSVYYEIYGRWPVKGNEDDYRLFKVIYAEDINDVILIDPVIDHPYTLLKPYDKISSYLGISPPESVMHINMMAHVVTSMGLENLIANMRRLIFYVKESGITPGDFTDQTNGGYIGFSRDATGMQQVSQIVQEFQGRDINVQSMQAYLALFNDWGQKSTLQSDLFTYGIKPSTGGLNHAGYSATGANIVDNNMKSQVSYVFGRLGKQHESHWDKKLLAMQQYLPDDQIIEIAGSDPIEIRKATSLGNYKIDIVSGMVTNKNTQLQAVQNILQFVAPVLQAAQGMGVPVNADVGALLREAAVLGNVPNAKAIFPPSLPVQIPTQNQNTGEVGSIETNPKQMAVAA
ncbi:MAG: hypothetical protein WC716_16655 [Chitinophagaceae bacterium]|jgi:hypothetical protein